MEVIPTTLAENAGLNSIRVVTDLRHRHEFGEKNAGVSIRSGGVKNNMQEENVLQPLLVSTSAVELAAETVKMILRYVFCFCFVLFVSGSNSKGLC